MSKIKLSKRELYLYDTLRLSHDPFAYTVAELELHADDVDPFFFSYFVSPKHLQEKSLLEAIKEPVHATIYGQVGSGKTTLRYALEAACRSVPDRTLVVSIEIGKSYSSIFTEQTGKALLLEAIATDLFVQFLEQFHLLRDVLTPSLIRQLSQIWQTTIPAFRRRLARWLEEGEPEGLVGISRWWAVWHRAIVNYTPLTKERNAFLRTILSIDISSTNEAKPTLEESINLAKAIGYEHVFVLIDVAGTVNANQHQVQSQFHYILQQLFNDRFSLPLYLKAFLPLTTEPLFEESIQSYKQLTFSFFSAIMDWKDPEFLQAIIVNRFRSAGSVIKGFEAIASQEIVHQINAALIAAANGSPRRLLQLASLLITAHGQRDPTDPVMTAEDWQKMCQLWGFGPPEPTPLLTTTEPSGESS